MPSTHHEGKLIAAGEKGNTRRQRQMREAMQPRTASGLVDALNMSRHVPAME